MELEEHKIEIVAESKKADELYSLMTNSSVESMDLPALPLTAIKDFIDEKRDNLWEVTINGEIFLTVKADREAALALLKMVKGAGYDEFVMAPLPAKNLRAFVQGQRKNVATLTIRRNPDVTVRVKPDKDAKEAKESKEKKKEDKE
jgi:hypothetical protein